MPGDAKARPWLTIFIAAAASALVWALSPWLTGHAEPWDAEGLYYWVALVVAGAAAGLIVPRPVWAHYAGAVVGQLAYEAVFLPVGPLLVLGAAFLLGYSLIFLAAAAAAAHLHGRHTSPNRE